MRFFFVIASFIFISTAKSQHSASPKIISEQEVEYPSKDTADIEVFNICISPEEPSVDIEKWKAYLINSLVLDDASMDTISAGMYTVFVQFIVGENGRLINVSILKEPGHGFGERVKKAILNCQGIWKPVIDDNGHAIISYRIQPITFVIEESCEELPAALML